MNLERIEQLKTDFFKALGRLKEVLIARSGAKDVIADAAIQRFEFTFELAWKLAKAVLNYQGIKADTPREVIKESFKIELVDDGDAWIAMLDDRNMTSHTYDQAGALKIYRRIKKEYVKLLSGFADKVKNIKE